MNPKVTILLVGIISVGVLSAILYSGSVGSDEIDDDAEPDVRAVVAQNSTPALGTEWCPGDSDCDTLADAVDPDPMKKNASILYYSHSGPLSEKVINQIVSDFSKAPIKNPDGSTGIKMEFIYGGNIPKEYNVLENNKSSRELAHFIEEKTQDESSKDYIKLFYLDGFRGGNSSDLEKSVGVQFDEDDSRNIIRIEHEIAHIFVQADTPPEHQQEYNSGDKDLRHNTILGEVLNDSTVPLKDGKQFSKEIWEPISYRPLLVS